MQINIHKMTADWDEASACWDNCNDNYDKHITDYIIYKYDENSPFKFNYFNITAIVKDWYVNGNNYGVMLKDNIETYNYPQSDSYFLSANTHVEYIDGRPMIQIVYRNQTGLESNMTYHTQNIGRAGEVSTNDYNGNVVLVHTDVETPGNILPASVSHVYNTNNKDIDISYGKGFRLNYNQDIILETINNVEYAKYIDEDGTEHYFKKKENNIYVDEDGLNLRLRLENNIFIMQDIQGNILRFKKLSNRWVLYESENTEQQKITINVDDNGRVLSVTDGAGKTITLEYANGRLVAINDISNRKTQYYYNANGNLVQVKYSDGKSSYYEYDYLDLLVKVINIDGYTYVYDYYREKVNRVRRIQEYKANNQGVFIDIDYENNTTKFTTHEGYSNVYTFNNAGRTISIADFGKETNNVNNAYGKMYEYGTSDENKNKLTLESNLINVKEMPNNIVKNPYFDEGLNYWQKQDNSNADECTISMDNNNVYRTVGYAYYLKKICQRIEVSGKKGDIYNLSYWVKSLGIQEEGTSGKSVRVSVGVIRNDDSIQWIDSIVNTDTSQWQYMSKEFITDNDYKAITIYLMNNYNANETFWDNIGLFKDEKGNSYQYDKSGNIVSSESNAKQESTFKYSSEGEVAKSINPKGGSYVYEYDYNHKNRLLKAVNTIGQEYSFDYDNKGNVVKSTLQETDKAVLPENNRIYNIKFASTNSIMDVRDSKTDNGTKIEQWEFLEGYKNKEYKFVEQEDGYFKIIANHSNKAVDLDVDSGIIQQWSERNSDNQLWKAIDNGDGTIRLANKEKGDDYCISLENDSAKDGNRIIVSKWEGKSTQKLKLYDIDGNNTLLDEMLIESGEVYRIKAKHSGLYLEANGDVDVNSTEITQQEYESNDKKQLWRISRRGESTYRVTNLASKQGKVLDVRGGVNENDVQTQIYQASKDNVAQEWKIEKNKDNTFSFRTKFNGEGRTLTIHRISKEIGAKATIYSITGGDEQSFYLEKADLVDLNPGATYKIKAKHSGKYLGVKDGKLEQQDSNDENSQRWILKKLNNGYYKIALKADTSKVIDIDDASTIQGTSVGVFSDFEKEGGNEAQEFEFVPAGDGSFSIKPKLTYGQRCLDVQDASLNSGAKIWSWGINNTAAQQFYLEEIIPAEEKKYIETTGEYSEDGRYLTKQVDQSGNETNYEYEENKGLITKEIDANNGETIYNYDSNTDLTTKVSKQVGDKEYANTYTYENDNIKTINHNGITYEFVYDDFGNVTNIKVGNQSLKATTYGDRNGNLIQSTYGNNQNIKYQYDRFNRIIKKEKTTGNIEFSYDAKSNLKEIKDNTTGITTNYSYDLANRMTKATNNKGLTISYEYDDNSNINKTEYKLNDKTNIMNHNYDSDNNINSILFNNSVVKVNYDRLARGTSKDIINEKGTYTTQYGYKNTGTPNKTTTILESIKNGNNEAIHYTYNNMGYIETIKNGNELLAKYQYDELGQLTREDNKEQEKTITYEYDTGGNILNKKEYAYTEGEIITQPTKVIEYIYNNANWKDQLTTYNGKEITYDAIGNPLTYDGNTYTWQNGRELAGIQNTEKGLNITYKYTDDGIRTEKTVNGETTTYYLDGEIVIYETKGNDTIYYQYDDSQNLIGFKLNDEQYYYIRNGQNDIIGILDNNLNQIVRYTYDTWGKLISIKDGEGNDVTNNTNHIGYKNPYRYRGYRYDTETGLYYLQSRYYNPGMGRFINQDELTSTGQGLLEHNMYVYCNNNPVNMTDITGDVAGVISIRKYCYGNI